MNAKETLSHLFHRHPDPPEVEQDHKTEESSANKYSVESENLAVPEIHTKDHEEELKKREEEQNRSVKEQNVVFDTLAMPEIHFKK